MTFWNRLLAPWVLGALMAGSAMAQNISIATGGTGGVYYSLGGGMAAVLSKNIPGLQATAEVTGGSVDRSEERRVGKECELKCRSRWSPYH